MFRSRKTPTPEQIAKEIAAQREADQAMKEALWARLDANAKRLDAVFERMRERDTKEPKR